jgi:hypothetical protein
MVFLLITQTNLNLLPYVEDRFDDDPRFVNAVLKIMDEPSAPQLFTCLWRLWMHGAFPATIGDHIFNIRPKSADATWHVVGAVTVTGLIASVPGTFSQSILKNAEAGEIERLRVSAKFAEIKGPLTLEPVNSEEALSAIAHKEPMSLVRRVRVPPNGNQRRLLAV